MTLRRLAVGAIVWVLVLGVTRTVVALPEMCPELTIAGARAASVEAVDWFDRNQLPDGRWVYRYDRASGEVDRRPHDVRHSGVTMSLYQAAAAGIDGARAIADRGTAWSLDNSVRHDDFRMVASGSGARTGASALLVVGLSVRKADTGDERYDDELRALGRFLVRMTEPSGAVLEEWDVAARRPVPGAYSTYFTGETYFALAWLATVDPEGGWREPAERIGRYLARERDRVEDVYPPLPDHWAAYGMEQMANGAGVPLDAAARSYAGRLGGLFGVSVRYESQRTGEGINEALLRGGQTLGAGLGTLGEALGALWRLDGDENTAARLRCTAGMLADRQAGGGTHERGAWFRDDVTQMDDQQHALSALLAAEPAIAEGEGSGRGGPSGDDDGGRVLWLALVAAASIGRSAATRRGAATFVLGALAITALVAGPVVRAVDISPPTALIAAGLALGLTAAVDVFRAHVATFLRPATFLVVLGIAADTGTWPGLLAAVAASVATAVGGARGRLVVAAVALLGAVDLVMDGVMHV